MADTYHTEEPDHDEADLGYRQAVKYGRDLARLYKLERAKRQELELAHQKLQTIFETAPNGLAVLNETMTIVEVNPHFEALVEQDGGCRGHLLVELLPSDDLAAALEIAAKEGNRFAQVEVTLSAPLNRTLHVTGAPLLAGDQRGWVVSLHDITERKKAEDASRKVAAFETLTSALENLIIDSLGNLHTPIYGGIQLCEAIDSIGQIKSGLENIK